MNDPTRCPVCHNLHGGSDVFQGFSQPQGIQIKCGVCGDFVVSREAIGDYLDSVHETRLTALRRARLSHYIRVEQKPAGREIPFIPSNVFERAIRDDLKLPSPAQQALNLIRLIGEEDRRSGEPLEELPEHAYATIGAANPDAVIRLALELRSRGQIIASAPDDYRDANPQNIALTLSGWEVFEAEARGSTSAGVAIIAMEFDVPVLDAFVDAVVKPAALEAGYQLERVSDSPRAGIIDHIMRVKIRDAPFVVADLSHGNQGAYWEAGFAEGLGKPVIYICNEDVWASDKTHFDTNHCEHVVWHPEKADEFRERFAAVIRNSMHGRK